MTVAIASVTAYVLSIVLANWLVATVQPVVVWPSPELRAPAGVFAAGLCFTFRNLVQQTLGRTFGFVAIALGALLSATLFQSNVMLGGVLPLPLASGLTFALSEGVDAVVWTRLRQRDWWTRAMLLGDVAGQVVDSAVFLLLAFGSLEFLAGQIVGKWWTLIPALLITSGWRHRGGFHARHASAQLARTH